MPDLDLRLVRLLYLRDPYLTSERKLSPRIYARECEIAPVLGHSLVRVIPFNLCHECEDKFCRWRTR